jgi:hypothetical protein
VQLEPRRPHDDLEFLDDHHDDNHDLVDHHDDNHDAARADCRDVDLPGSGGRPTSR